MTPVPVLAIGRSRILYDAAAAVAADPRYHVAAVITDTAYAEYDVGIDDFRRLADHVGAEFRVERQLSVDLVDGLVGSHGITIGISANWRYLIPPAVLKRLPHGVLNLHLGRLPDYKGNATANWAILAGEPDISADVHQMAAALDAGDVLARRTMTLDESTYIGDVLAWTHRVAPDLFLAALENALGSPVQVVVPGATSGLRCYPRLPEDGTIDWTWPATQVARLVRASSDPYPGAFTGHEDCEVRVWRAAPVSDPPDRFLAVPGQVLVVDRDSGTVDVACGTGVLRLEEIGVEGRRIRPTEEIRGIRARLRPIVAPWQGATTVAAAKETETVTS